jgi:flagellar motor switch protein FliG
MSKKVKVNGGPQAAAELLSSLDPASREEVVRKMKELDPELTEHLISGLLSLDDLPKMTLKMLQDFLKRVEQKDLVLALKLCSSDTQNFFIEKANRSLSIEIKESLAGPKVPKSKCEEARGKVLIVVRRMIEEGSLVLNDNDEYV